MASPWDAGRDREEGHVGLIEIHTSTSQKNPFGGVTLHDRFGRPVRVMNTTGTC